MPDYSFILAIDNISIMLLKILLLFFLGKMLTYPEQLRNFLGLNRNTEKELDYSKTSFWLKKLGQFFIVISVIRIIALVGKIIFSSLRGIV